MTSLEKLDDPALEAVRLAQLSRGHQRLGDHASAISAAERAVAVQPDTHWLSERLGDAAAAGGQYDYALSALNDALRKIAIQAANPLPRARLYRKIAEVEQTRGRPDRAYDAYKRALAANPDDAQAQQRILEMERAAGN
ncbi:MAG: tetratricopeptide repeat protein [Acidobacteria bacterium]|nr:MAG: tetratricopeptide repeat protein [Acidobacteriota bacterium]